VDVEIDVFAVTGGEAMDEGDGTYTVTYTPTENVPGKEGKKKKKDKAATASTHSKLPLKRHHESFISRCTSDETVWERQWFSLKEHSLMCYGTNAYGKDSSTGGSVEPTLVLELSECAVSEFVDFPEAPHPASHHLQVVAPHLTLQLCCDTEQSMTNWLALLKKSSVNGQQSNSVVTTTAPASSIMSQVKGDIVISISLNGDLLSSCPFTPKVSAKLGEKDQGANVEVLYMIF